MKTYLTAALVPFTIASSASAHCIDYSPCKNPEVVKVKEQTQQMEIIEAHTSAKEIAKALTSTLEHLNIHTLHIHVNIATGQGDIELTYPGKEATK